MVNCRRLNMKDWLVHSEDWRFPRRRFSVISYVFEMDEIVWANDHDESSSDAFVLLMKSSVLAVRMVLNEMKVLRVIREVPRERAT